MEETTITLPPKLAEQVKLFVQAGWFPDLNALVVEALRRYLETHRLELTEHYIWQDVEWGLRGND
ncbi:MAG TPA: ribbon-helix-helix domain-containing protein [Anaerolineae bacterium]|nr:ribbon-helix-helix domain-containing protein [Anaerolineae bacterium]